MAEPLKNQFGPEVPKTIARMIQQVYPSFKTKDFLKEIFKEYETLELMPRARCIAKALHNHLPENYTDAIQILINSLGPKLSSTKSFGMKSFIYLPHVFFVAYYGLNHFDVSMQAQYELTQRFTAEFSIRSYIQQNQDKALQYFKKWVKDPSPHVRRLVSEGSRPRLPWAQRLPEFQQDPSPMLPFLEFLKDDPDLYVRRSVANHLNDIGKDNPNILLDTCQRWNKQANLQTQWIIQHALRNLVKQGNAQAFKILGFTENHNVEIESIKFPKKIKIGESFILEFFLTNVTDENQILCVDLSLYYVKANAKDSLKVFKIKNANILARNKLKFSKKISFSNMTTRTHYKGKHRFSININGNVLEQYDFVLV